MTVPHEAFRDIDRQDFGRLHQRAIDALGHDRRPRKPAARTLRGASFSMSTESCSSPRPSTLKRIRGIRQFPCGWKTFRQQFRDPDGPLMLREVTYLPSRPANGELFDREVDRNRRLVDRNDRQRLSGLRARRSSRRFVMPGIPAIATMSPTAVLDRIFALEAVET